jgi:hypothetical protein
MTDTTAHLKIVASTKEPRPASPDDHDDVRYSQAAVGHRLRAARTSLNIPESEAHAACKVSPRTYGKWEAGGPLRNWHGQLCRLAEKFDVGVAWLA